MNALYQHCRPHREGVRACCQSFWPLTAHAPRPPQKRSSEGGDQPAALLQSAASTPASSSATFVARGSLRADVKEESGPPLPDSDSAGAVVTSACHAHVCAGPVSADSDGGKSTRTSGLQGSALKAVLAPGFVPVPPSRAAALAASATVARMAAAEAADGAPHTPLRLGLSQPVAACPIVVATQPPTWLLSAESMLPVRSEHAHALLMACARSSFRHGQRL